MQHITQIQPTHPKLTWKTGNEILNHARKTESERMLAYIAEYLNPLDLNMESVATHELLTDIIKLIDNKY